MTLAGRPHGARHDVRAIRALLAAAVLAVLASTPQRARAEGPHGRDGREAAISVAVAEAARRGLHRAAACVCWPQAAVRRLVRTLSASGVAVALLRGSNRTTAAAVEALLRQGAGQTLTLVDMACPAAARLLRLVSRLRLLDLANFWVLFEDGRFEPAADGEGASNDTDDFPDVDLVRVGRYGGQSREDALIPDEKVLLEVTPSAKGRSPRTPSQVALLSETARRALEPLLLLSDSRVLWVQPSANQTPGQDAVQGFVVFRTSMARDLQAYLAAEGWADGNGTAWTWVWTMSAEGERSIEAKRADLQNATLRAPTIVNFPKQYTHMEDIRDRKRDYRPKTNFPVVKNMAEQANVSMLVLERSDYGYNKDADGNFDGMIGELQRFECDLLSTAVYITNERLDVLDSVAETFPLRTAVVYRQSTSGSAVDLYVRPFSTGVWLAMAGMMVVCVVQLAATTRLWAWVRRTPAALSLADCVTSIVGMLCQQGAGESPESASGRTVVILMLFLSFFLFTSFSAFIVALLQAPPEPLHSAAELLASHLKLGGMDVAFIHAWFRGEMAKEVRGVVGDLFSKKIKTHERPGFLPVWEGIEHVRKGGYGYQAELNEAYHEIQETFIETQKCDLFEMELFPQEAQIIVTVERSPYREVFSRFVRWQRELGHLDRISKRWYATKPRCESGNRGFVPIGVREVVPLLLLLTYGVLLSLLFLVAEILSRNPRPRCAERSRWHLGWRRPRPLALPAATAPTARPAHRGRTRSGPPNYDRFDHFVTRNTLYWQARGLAMGVFAANLNKQKQQQQQQPLRQDTKREPGLPALA